MKSETVYRRKPNGRYEAIGDRYTVDCWPHGTHLVIAEPGTVRIIYNIDPAYAEVIAALEKFGIGMEEAMREATKLRPPSRKLTAEERRSYKAWQKCVPNMQSLIFEGVSIRNVIDAGKQYVLAAMKGGAR